MSKKGMRLVAMIEEKENGQYDVVNFLPDLKIKHIQGKEFEVIEEKDHIQIPYAQGIDDLTVIVGENGVGKTRLVNDIFSLDEKKMFVFKNLEEVDPIYKGKHTYYNFHALNGSSQGNDEWKLSFDGARLTEWDYEKECIPAEYWEGEEISEKEEYIDWFTRKVAIVKLSNAVEVGSPWGQGIDLSTTRLLKDGNYDNFLLSDMDKQIKFLLSHIFDTEKIEELLGFRGKKLKLFFNDDIARERLKGEIELGIDNSYLAELERFLRYKEFLSVEEKLHFLLTDYFAHIYSSGEFSMIQDNKIDYLGLFSNMNNMVIENQSLVRAFLRKYINEAKAKGKNVNTYLFYKLNTLSGDSTMISVVKAGYKYKFYNYGCKQRIEYIKKIVDSNSKQYIERIDELFNYSGEVSEAVFDLKEVLSDKSLKITFDNQKFKYLISEIERISQIFSIQKDIILHKYSFTIRRNKPWRTRFTFLRDIIQAISFQWPGLSSGQLALLNLFGRLHSLSEEVKDKESILLLLDEIDLGLHPEWQRKWVSTALPIIGEIFKGKHVQIILTTHSPIMLSDIYGENVLMLRKDSETGERQVVYGDEVPSTSFGQNIHQLFKESFFLEQTKGDYSLKVINATIKAVYDLNQEGADVTVIKANFASELGVGDLSDGQFRAYLEKVIGAIGEKVIAQKLQDMYQTIPLWLQASSLEGKRAGDLSTEELRQLLRQREEAGQ